MLVSKKMKKYIVNILVFFGIIVMVDFCISKVGDFLQAHAKGGITKRVNDLLMREQHDVLIMGSSRAHHHYDTPYLSDALGLDFYNAGFNGNGVVLADGILEIILERYKPRLILFDVEPNFDIIVYPEDNHHIRYINYLKPYYRFDVIKRIIKSVSLEEWYKVQSGMIRYNSDMLSKILDYQSSHRAKMGKKGFVPLKGIFSGSILSKEINQVEVDSFKLGYIEKLISLAKSKCIPIVFVASPSFGFTADVLQPVKDICSKNNILFLDYYSDHYFLQHQEWFKDYMHLNAEGARFFTDILLRDLESNHLLDI